MDGRQPIYATPGGPLWEKVAILPEPPGCIGYLHLSGADYKHKGVDLQLLHHGSDPGR